MSMQKNKGSGWERDVAKFLTEIFGYTFIRNIAGSGAFVGGKNSFRKNILTEEQLQFCMGDIAVPTEMKKMCIECKFYKEFPFHHFLINKPIPMLDGWIEQHLEIVDDSNLWFITFKINRAGSYIVIPERFIQIDDRLGNHSIYYHNGIRYIVADFEGFVKLYKDQIEEKSR